MEKAMTLPKATQGDGVVLEQIDSVLREIDHRLKRMKKVEGEIDRLRSKTRVSLDRLKAS